MPGSVLIWRSARKWHQHCGLARIRIVGIFAEFYPQEAFLPARSCVKGEGQNSGPKQRERSSILDRGCERGEDDAQIDRMAREAIRACIDDMVPNFLSQPVRPKAPQVNAAHQANKNPTAVSATKIHFSAA
jgi:hypothetical protein